MSSTKRNVLIIGGTGRTGSKVIEQLTDQNFNIKMLCRQGSQANAEEIRQKFSSNIDISTLDYETITDDDLISEMNGSDTVVCALGALESEPLNWKNPYRIDGKLTQRMITTASKSSSVKQFVLVSSLGTDRFGLPASILNLFWGILFWKRQSEKLLMSSGLDYTIIRPGGMERPTDEYELTHNMKLFPASTTFKGNISRKQIASLCVAACNNPTSAKNKIIEVIADESYPKKSAIELLIELPNEISDSEWRNKLTSMQYYILREAGTERPWTSTLNNEKRKGIYQCAGCGNELFSSETKFESGTGWPSFFKPISSSSIIERTDFLFGLVRTEVLCSNCSGHLGHVFPDGPAPTRLRYCMNGDAMKFIAKDNDVDDDSNAQINRVSQRILD
eukprot:gene12139-25477_t